MMRQHNDRAWLAWHSGLLSHPRKKFPKLDTLIAKPKSKNKPVQSWQEQMAVAHMWASRGYGKVTKVN